MAKQRKFSLIFTAKDKAKKVIGRVRQGLASIGKAALKASAVAGAAVTAIGVGMGAMIKSVLSANDQLAKTASKLGIATEELSGLRHAAELAGVPVNSMEMSLQRMTRRLSEAAAGGGEAVKAIEELGLNAEELNNMSPEQSLLTIIDALEGVENQSDRVRLAFKFFDSEGVSMVNLTGDALRSARKEAELFGIAVSQADSEKIEEIDDSFNRIKAALKGFGTVFTVGLLDPIQKISDKVAELAANGKLKEWAQAAAVEVGKLVRLFVTSIPRGLVFILELVGKVGMAFSGWKLIFNGLEMGWNAFQIVLWEGLRKARNGLTSVLEALNVGGIFDDSIAESKRIASEQDVIIDHLDKKLKQSVDKQKELRAEQQKQQATVDGYKKRVESLTSEFESLVEGQGQVAEGAKKMGEQAAAGHDKATAAADRYLKKLSELQAKQSMVSITPSGRDSGTTFGDSQYLAGIESSIAEAERTE